MAASVELLADAEFDSDKHLQEGALQIATDMGLVCVKCTLVARNPMSSNCGCMACYGCFPANSERKADARCFLCHAKNPQWELSAVLRRQIGRLKVKCDRCDWKSEQSNFHEHKTQKCPHRKIKCPLGCGQFYVLSAEPDHNAWCLKERQVKCMHCDQPFTMATLGRHDCPEEPITCACNERIKRKDLEKHQDADCDEAVVPCAQCNHPTFRREAKGHEEECPMRIVECLCKAKLPFKDKQQHLLDAKLAEVHLPLLVEKVETTIKNHNEMIDQGERTIKKLREEIKQLKQGQKRPLEDSGGGSSSSEKKQRPAVSSASARVLGRIPRRTEPQPSQPPHKEGMKAKCPSCSKTLACKMSRTTANPNRLFWTCKPPCKVFVWDDEFWYRGLRLIESSEEQKAQMEVELPVDEDFL